MHIEARLFEFLTAFFALCAVGYGALTAIYAYGGIEWAGTTALVLTTGLSLIIGTFFRFVARRLDTRPEDYEDAEIADGAGELGFYSPQQLVAAADRAVRVGDRGRGRAVVAVVDRRGRLSWCWRRRPAWCSSTTPAPRSTDRAARKVTIEASVG